MNNLLTNLCDISAGSRFKVCGIDDCLPIKDRLAELGFRCGADVEKLHVGPCGSPIAYRVCGAVLAIRAEDAEKITVMH